MNNKKKLSGAENKKRKVLLDKSTESLPKLTRFLLPSVTTLSETSSPSSSECEIIYIFNNF
jgi:hypothetical protein